MSDSTSCTDRRDFLQSAGCVGLTLALCGLASPARALPVLTTTGSGPADERRYPIPAADSVNIDRAAQLIVVRLDSHVFVFALSCPHQNNALKWVPNEHRFQCTKHDSRYQADGVHTAGRATRNMDRYIVKRDGDLVVVNLRQWVRSDTDPAAWAAAAIAV